MKRFLRRRRVLCSRKTSFIEKTAGFSRPDRTPRDESANLRLWWSQNAAGFVAPDFDQAAQLVGVIHWAIIHSILIAHPTWQFVVVKEECLAHGRPTTSTGGFLVV
jgi:hypothetical protein